MSGASNDRRRVGFDAAIRKQEEDDLNRWPLAREIYGICVTGPPEWSVRVGIYGEWGTGKSSVLQLVEGMARKEGHIVICFNPWEHSTKDALWRAFILAIFNEPSLQTAKGAKIAQLKNWASKVEKATKVLEAGVAVFHDKSGKAVGAGLDLVKKFFSFNQKDLGSLRASLGTRRMIILIDDLDRTAPELVPEILFALKELLDVPDFSFICAFDPVVVGEVLGRYHPGFGDGLKFLEKIIDYPRWLPPAPVEGLTKLAIADSKRYCPYVPELALRDAVPLLPANPRAIRQFIRLLALLRPQIERHYPDELRWPSILAANVLKIRYPRIAHAVLKDEAFWEKIEGITVLAKDQEEKEQLNKAIHDHLNDVVAKNNIPLGPWERNEVTAALRSLCTKVSIWLGGGAKTLAYQMDLAEAPHAVTWKEYDQFFAIWQKTPTRQCAETWIGKHAELVSRLPVQVQQETFQAAIQRYAEALQAAEIVLTDSEKGLALKKIEQIIDLLECLIFALGDLNQPEKRLSADDLELLFQKFTSFTNSLSPVHMHFQARNEAVLFRLLKEWVPDVMPLVKVLKPYGYFPGGAFDREETQVLHQKLCKALLPNLAMQVRDRFREPGFAKELFSHENETYAIRGIILDINGPMWTELRKSTVALFQEARTNAVIQENAFELLHFFDYKLRKESGSIDAVRAKDLISDKDISALLWSTATATRLSPAATAHLNQAVSSLRASGANFQLPAWWEENMKVMTSATEAAKAKAGVGEKTNHGNTSPPEGTQALKNPN